MGARAESSECARRALPAQVPRLPKAAWQLLQRLPWQLGSRLLAAKLPLQLKIWLQWLPRLPLQPMAARGSRPRLQKLLGCICSPAYVTITLLYVPPPSPRHTPHTPTHMSSRLPSAAMAAATQYFDLERTYRYRTRAYCGVGAVAAALPR